ncbi:ABC-F family ATP-binding cassette domain-containing protein [Mycoplasmatota bacterium WC44]
MSILNVQNVTHSFGGRDLLDDVSFRLLKGEKIGLIGANGEGKSTFMNIITNKLVPDEGVISWAKRVRVGYLDQHTKLNEGNSIKDILKTAFKYLFDTESEINELYMKMAEPDLDIDELMIEVGELQNILDNSDFYMIDSKIEQVSKGLGILDIGLDKDVTELSGGQRSKVLLAKLLLERPDILLLDEPTNYLDEVHINWLRQYLINYENAFIIISHDLEFLDSVINIIYHLENLQLTRYVGDYSHFRQAHATKQKQLESAFRKQQQEITKLKDFVQKNKANVATRNMAMSRQKKLDKMDVITLSKEKPKPEFYFKTARTPSREIFQMKDLVIGYDKPLSKPFNKTLLRNQKVAITGTNGIGKTTLLKSLIGEIKSLSGKVIKGEFIETGYFAQEVSDFSNKNCIDFFWDDFPSYNQYEVRSALAKCGLTTDHIENKVHVLSGGEQAKVRLSKILNIETNVLVLDEPTNHLDQDAKNELKKALNEYKGTILLISHDPFFYKDIVTEVWNLEEWTLSEF